MNKKYEQRIVAFIDILGFKEIIRESEKNSANINLIFEVLEYLKKWETTKKWNIKFIEIEEDVQKKGLQNFEIKDRTNVTCFSDSIVVSAKIDQDNINHVVSTIISNLAYIGAVLLEKGILLRGAITVGNLIHEANGIILGNGLIEAYLLENSCAKYPRIIISDKLIKRLEYPINSKRQRYPYHQYLYRFEDGCVGFHQLIYFQAIQNSTLIDENELANNLNAIRKVIIRGLDSSFEKQDVFLKYKWLKEQYNELLILENSSTDLEDSNRKKLKHLIKNINEGLPGNNIHYNYTDDVYEKSRNEYSQYID